MEVWTRAILNCQQCYDCYDWENLKQQKSISILACKKLDRLVVCNELHAVCKNCNKLCDTRTV